MQEHFATLADRLQQELRGDEVFTCSYRGETSDFVRFNRSAVRQAGSVSQVSASIDLISGRRHAAATLTLSGSLEEDTARVTRALGPLRDRRAAAPEDPLLLYAKDSATSAEVGARELPEPEAVVADVQRAGRDRDLVGMYAAGDMHTGFASSFGQRNWDTRSSFHLDWSFYLEGDKAVKSSYAGFRYDPAELARREADAADKLRALDRQPRTIAPGPYRVYLAPSALQEIVDMLCWGGFGLRAHRTKTTPLLRMIEESATLARSVSITENTRGGLAPPFQESGFLRPPEVPLIREGAYEDTLVSPRSSVEYGVATNGASSHESPLSVDVAPGELAGESLLAELGTGIYVSNLWYLNYSDRNACRTTGMTRFATFWVENGAIQAPLAPMRFDETVFRMLGPNLRGLSRERELLLDAGTYGRRSARSARLPGVLVDDFVFTL